jgi:hypothetical protein
MVLAGHESPVHLSGSGTIRREGTYRSEDRMSENVSKETRTEEHKVRGENLVSKVKEIIHEGNVRRISIKNDEGKELIEIPLTLGVVGTLLLPAWAAVGAIAALVTNCSIVVEREEEPGGDGEVELEVEVEVEVEEE